MSSTTADGYPYFRFFVAEFQLQTARLSIVEKGAYVVLLTAMHEAGEAIAFDCKRLARAAGTKPATMEKAIEALLDVGLILQPVGGYLWSPVSQREKEKRVSRSEIASQNVSQRWEKGQRNQRHKDTGVHKSQSQSQNTEGEPHRGARPSRSVDRAQSHSTTESPSPGTRVGAHESAPTQDDPLIGKELRLPEIGLVRIKRVITREPLITLCKPSRHQPDRNFRVQLMDDGKCKVVGELTDDDVQALLNWMEGNDDAA